MYINKLYLTGEKEEDSFIINQKRNCYNGIYPFKIFPMMGLKNIEFSDVTIFYGGNGSGKSTLLNIIAEKGGLIRHSAFSNAPFFNDYIKMCSLDSNAIPRASQIITSDDVSDFLLNIRYLNDGIEVRRNELFEEYLSRKYADHRLNSLDDYDEWKENLDAKRSTQSEYVRNRLMRDVEMRSNGETAMRYYVERINENAVYLIDEPENSLSAKLQIELCDYIIQSARYYNCQFVISTHSPFFLSIPSAKIYDLDSRPVKTANWTELENVRIYYEFFKTHEAEF